MGERLGNTLTIAERLKAIAYGVGKYMISGFAAEWAYQPRPLVQEDIFTRPYGEHHQLVIPALAHPPFENRESVIH